MVSKVLKKSARESILTNTSLKPPESHTAPVYVNPKDKGIFNFSRTINKPVKLIHLQGIIKWANTVNTLVLLHFYMRGAFLCVPERQFFLEGKKGKLLLMKGGSLFESQEAKSQSSTEGVARAGRIFVDNGKIKGNWGNSSDGKEAWCGYKYSSRNGSSGCLEAIAKLGYTASLLSKCERRLGWTLYF